MIVATCSSAAHIVNALRKKDTLHGWFSHVIVDEAGEATEPETLIPLSLLKPVVGCAVLAGDHFQLGPHVTSLLAARTGKLEQSMLERIANERLAESGLDTPEALEDLRHASSVTLISMFSSLLVSLLLISSSLPLPLLSSLLISCPSPPLLSSLHHVLSCSNASLALLHGLLTCLHIRSRVVSKLLAASERWMAQRCTKSALGRPSQNDSG